MVSRREATQHGRSVVAPATVCYLVESADRCPAGAFDNSVDAKRTLREIMLLRQLRHENVIAIKDVMRPPGPAAFTDLYVVYELADTDLHQVIRSSQPLSDDHVQYFLYQARRAGCLLGALAGSRVANPDLARLKVPTQRQRAASRSQAQQVRARAPPLPLFGAELTCPASPSPKPAAERKLRPQDLRFWAGPHRHGARVHD